MATWRRRHRDRVAREGGQRRPGRRREGRPPALPRLEEHRRVHRLLSRGVPGDPRRHHRPEPRSRVGVRLSPVRSARDGRLPVDDVHDEERETGFTQEIFVSPTSRVSIFLGKILGGSVAGLISLPALFLVAFAIGVPITLTLIEVILLIAPVFCLMGGAFGVLLSGIFGTNPKAVDQATILTMFPQMFLSGAV